MPLSSLEPRELEIVRSCLECIAGGEVIFHDFEFDAIMGVTVEEFFTIYDDWPLLDEADEKVLLVINNTFNNLLGYPHGLQLHWEQYVGHTVEEIGVVFGKWKSAREG